MAQAEKQFKLFGGPDWQLPHLWLEPQPGCRLRRHAQQKHTGIGASIDQRVGDGIKLFARYGKLIKGELPLIPGTGYRCRNQSGNYWGRGSDSHWHWHQCLAEGKQALIEAAGGSAWL